ncbi:MAG: hypothetical protein BJ554DRAFT_8458 [Olpidium bornovanus]|uniref:Rho-GAP domain-containing protein n=1 Tax=Olpidium bornovanus TaxID=278681 RepID=A0A8H8DM09_9FUNG|nr:MAG: hypothetical protein BJ554DRAFT_8458 [Olpidium bornovanus]
MKTTINELKNRFNTEGDVNLAADEDVYYDVHAVAGLLKLFLRELPVTILTVQLQTQFLHVMGKPAPVCAFLQRGGFTNLF